MSGDDCVFLFLLLDPNVRPFCRCCGSGSDRIRSFLGDPDPVKKRIRILYPQAFLCKYYIFLVIFFILSKIQFRQKYYFFFIFDFHQMFKSGKKKFGLLKIKRYIKVKSESEDISRPDPRIQKWLLKKLNSISNTTFYPLIS